MGFFVLFINNINSSKYLFIKKCFDFHDFGTRLNGNFGTRLNGNFGTRLNGNFETRLNYGNFETRLNYGNFGNIIIKFWMH